MIKEDENTTCRSFLTVHWQVHLCMAEKAVSRS